MAKNFWTEENKIMNYDSLIRADMKRRLMKLENQIVYGRDIADLCYNYDFFISQRDKAIQFITDYAEHFVKCLDMYKKKSGRMFPGVQNPSMAANLMVLYQGRDIANSCETIKENWDRKFVLNLDTLDQLMKEVDNVHIPEHERLNEKAFITKTTLNQVSVEYLYDELKKFVGENITLAEALKRLNMPVLSEQTAKSLLKNSYSEIAELADKANTKDLYLFVEDVVHKKSQEVFEKEFAMTNKDVPLSKELVAAIKNTLSMNFRREVELKPLSGVKARSKSELVREAQKPIVREK